jgi:hypothetical protein
MLFVYFSKTDMIYMVLFAIYCFFFTIDRRPIQIGVMYLHTSLVFVLVFTSLLVPLRLAAQQELKLNGINLA